MCHSYRMIFTLVAAIVVMLSGAQAQDNPYRVEEGWAKFPDGKEVGIHVRGRRRSRRQHLGF